MLPLFFNAMLSLDKTKKNIYGFIYSCKNNYAIILYMEFSAFAG